MKNFGSIYIIKNFVNDKVYIGKTIESIEVRFQEHKKNCNRENCKDRPLYRAMNKHGIDKFYVELLEKCEINILSQKEQEYILLYDSYKNGYNATLGGDGKVLYDYQQIVSGFLDGKLIKDLAEEFECCVDTISKAIVSAGLKSNNNGVQARSRKVIMIDKDTEESLQTFNSLSNAAQWLIDNGITSAQTKHIVSCISKVLKGERQTAYEYKWKEGPMDYNRRTPF